MVCAGAPAVQRSDRRPCCAAPRGLRVNHGTHQVWHLCSRAACAAPVPRAVFFVARCAWPALAALASRFFPWPLPTAFFFSRLQL